MVRARLGLILAVCFAVVLGACGGNTRTKEQYIESGDKFASEKRFSEALLEYLNAAKVDDKYGPAHAKLSQTYIELNQKPRALAEAVRAADLMADDDNAQLTAARMLLLAEKYDDAKNRAQIVLGRNPKNVEAQVIKANAMVGFTDLEQGVKDVQQAIASDPKDSRSYAALGVMQMKQGQRDEAEAAFKQAVATQPDSFVAQTALGHFYWSVGKIAEAEAPLKKALEISPGNVQAARALVVYYLATNRAKDAQPVVKSLAAAAKSIDSRIGLAELYEQVGLADEAIATLKEVAKDKDGFADATVHLAQFYVAQNKVDDAAVAIDEVLAKQPKHVAALMLKARLLANKGEIDNAIVRAKEATTFGRRPLPEAFYLLGQLYTQRGLLDEAVAAQEEVVKLDPKSLDARLQLAQLHLYKAQQVTAAKHAQDALNIAPGNGAARLMYARTLLANRKTAEAEPVLRELVQASPNNAFVQSALGELALAKKDGAAAKKYFERATALDPTSFDSLHGLINAHLLAKDPAGAVKTIEDRLAKSPKDPGLLLLGSITYAGVGDVKKQEELLKKIVEVDPTNLSAFANLAALYVQQGRLEEAKAEYRKVAERQPGSVTAPTMVGMILEAQGKFTDAERQYEKVIADHPKAPIAANNLAWLYTEHDGNLDMALTLVQKARPDMPKSPDIDDTEGWIYYKKDLATMAVPLLEQASRARPDNALFAYHLGMAQAKVGNKDKAKAAFDLALMIKPDYKEAAEAVKNLK